MKRTLFFLMLVLITAAPLVAQIGPDDSIYFIMTDRFYDGNTDNNYSVRSRDIAAYHGGDFAGIQAKLDYIEALGFTALWISPVVDNQIGGYHGYWARDFYATEEHFGTLEELKSLVDAAHDRGIKVIIDLVVNHTGSMSPMVSDPETADWFHPRLDISDFNNQQEAENHWLSGLPDFDTENPEVRQYLIDMTLWWIDEVGFDGYRLDTVRHVPHAFWQNFSDAIHARYPDFYLIGEAFNGDFNFVGSYQRSGIDGMLDFPLYFPARDFLTGDGSAQALASALGRRSSYLEPELMGTFLDNHDVNRYVNQMRGLVDERISQGLLFLFTAPGIPVMYYGTEIPLDGSSDHSGRADMKWENSARYAGMVRILQNLRAENPSLRTGDLDILYSDTETLVYSRSDAESCFLTVLYQGDEVRNIRLEGLPEGFNSAVRLMGTAWTGDSGGSVRPRKYDLEQTDGEITAFARHETVVPAEEFTAEGLPSSFDLLEEGSVSGITSGSLSIRLEPNTGALYQLSEEKAPVPWWVWAAGGGALAVGATVLALILAGQ